MSITLLGILDLVGTIAFAIAGAVVAIGEEMDLFGINVLAVCTATGGGVIRDLLISNTPPSSFRNPFYVAVAAVTANIVFVMILRIKRIPKNRRHNSLTVIYDKMLFWFDTLGLAAFTIDGVMAGIRAGHGDNLFLIIFLGMMTGVGGGALRDILANRMPAILYKHVYALSSIAGGLIMAVLAEIVGKLQIGMAAGFMTVIALRCLAVHFEWNLPRMRK